MADRFFPNEMPDFMPELEATIEEAISSEKANDPVTKLLSLPYGTLSERLKKAALGLKDTIVRETWVLRGKRVSDYTLYTGTLGTAYLLFKAYRVTKNENDLKLCSEIVKACDSASRGSGRVTFICGEAGVYALGAAVAKHMGDERLLGRYLTQFKEIKLPKDLPNELLYGRAGFLWACSFLNKHIGKDTVPSVRTRAIVDDVIKSGRQLADKRRYPLMFEWHGKKYWGAAHGLAGIMHVLMDMELRPDEMEDVKGTLRYMIKNRFPSGNYPSSEGNESDRLVHWCHGASGVAITLVKAAEVFGGQEFVQAAVESGEVVWNRGLLKRVGVCHGISGNAYVFLSLYRLTGDAKYLYRAKAFACFLLDRAQKLISEGEMHGGDRPYSLFEGIGGMTYLFLDMVEPSEAKFPVDAGEGPLAQTKFVLAKALKYGLRPILLLNKVDRPSVSEERCNEVESLVFDLFANLGATEEQLEFPVLYASAKEGWASSTFTKNPPDDAKNMSQLLDAIVRHVRPPTASLDAPFQMLVSMMERDFYLGRILSGRISSGIIHVGDKIHGLRINESGVEKVEEGKVVKLMKKRGTSIVPVESAGAGDIISMAGLASPAIGHTIASVEVMTALPTVELDPPTISMTFSVNDSPLAGRDGTHLTGGKIGDRLMTEAETNLAINVIPGLSESYEVQGRGELQLGILIENMRREGFELSVSPPKVMYKIEKGKKLEPLEEVTVEVNDEHVGVVMEALSHRRAEVLDMGPVPGNFGRTRMSLTCPSRGLVGYRSVFSSNTRGTGFMHRAFLSMLSLTEDRISLFIPLLSPLFNFISLNDCPQLLRI